MNKLKVLMVASGCLFLSYDAQPAIRNWPVAGRLINAIEQSRITGPVVSFIGRHKVASAVTALVIVGICLWKNRTSIKYAILDLPNSINSGLYKISRTLNSPKLFKMTRFMRRFGESDENRLKHISYYIEHDSPEAIKFLVKSGVDPHKALSPLNFNFLVSQVHDAGLRNLKALLDCKVDPNRKDKEGKTALHVSVKEFDPIKEKVEMLLDAGAEVNAKDNNGLTPLDYALKHCPSAMGILSLLRAKGATSSN